MASMLNCLQGIAVMAVTNTSSKYGDSLRKTSKPVPSAIRMSIKQFEVNAFYQPDSIVYMSCRAAYVTLRGILFYELLQHMAHLSSSSTITVFD